MGKEARGRRYDACEPLSPFDTILPFRSVPDAPSLNHFDATGAALIMVAIFAGFASGELVMFQQVGFGLGAAVLLDATIVRSFLVPAAMTLLGVHNWYLPRWLERLPEVQIE